MTPITQRVLLMQQELRILQDHLKILLCLVGIVVITLKFSCVVFVYYGLFFYSFLWGRGGFGDGFFLHWHCILCPSIYAS